MAEATEELVKIYLEQKGFLVTTSKRANTKIDNYATRAELDILAIRTKEVNDGLPNKIIGEVKSFKIHYKCFKSVYEELKKKYGYKSRDSYSRYKWVNDKKYRSDIAKSIENEYGLKDFTFVLFCGGIENKHSKEVNDFLEKENIKVVTHKEVLKELFETRTNEYTNNDILQLIRLIKNNAEDVLLSCKSKNKGD